VEHRRTDEGAVAGRAFARLGQPPPFPEYKTAVFAACRLDDETPAVLLDSLFDVLQVAADVPLGDPRINGYLARREGLLLKKRCNKTAYRLVPFNGRLRLPQSLSHRAHIVALI